MTKKECFLLAPIGSPGSEVRRRSDMLLKHVLQPAAEETGYTLIRADEIAAPGLITAQILRLTLEAPLAIADLSGRNPNVLYELGVRHSSGKPVIQIASDQMDLPFDVAAVRTIIVDLKNLDSVEKARRELIRSIRHVEEHPKDIDSPIATAVNLKSLESINAAQEQPDVHSPSDGLLATVAGIMGGLDSRMKALEFKIERSLKPPDFKREYSRRIFIVHGHDGELKNELARFLERLDFEPIILHEQADRGRTIFSKLNGEMVDVGFAFILLTPDDVGGPLKKNLQPRARQNVIFEHGLFVAALSPERVCAIRRGDVEIPSDLQGVLYKTIPPDGNLKSIAIELANELRAAGYILDANKMLNL